MKQEILDRLPAHHPWRRHVHIFDTLDSTNTYAAKLAKAGAPEGTVVIARQQTAGRGRRGRTFLSPMDTGLYMSVILRPGCPPAELMHLTCAVAVALCDAVEQVTGVRPQIKWINDLVLNKRKLAGILTELGFTAQGMVDHAVIGIGINVSQFPAALQGLACSLLSETGRSPTIGALAAAVMISLETINKRLLSERDAIMETYRRDCITLGSDVQVLRASFSRQGTAMDIRTDGALVVHFPDGSQEAVFSGEVSVRGLWDYV